MNIIFLISAGIVGGILGGMGMGGGTLLIPLLTLCLGFEQHEAQWLNLAVFVPMSFVAITIHAKNRLVKVKPLLLTICGALPASILFSFVATKASSETLGKFFGVFLVVLGAVNIIKILRPEKKVIPIIPKDE